MAPDFASFIALFIENGYGPYYDDKGYEKVPRPPRDLLAVQARWYALASRESVRRLFEDVGEYYAVCSAEERREAEAQVRDEMEKRGMTDEQRQRLENLWNRLRLRHPS